MSISEKYFTVKDVFGNTHLVKRSKRMFQVFHADGSYRTQYTNLSEAETYFRNSFDGAEFDSETKSDQGIVVVTDAEGNEVGEIRGPKPRLDPTAANGNPSPPSA